MENYEVIQKIGTGSFGSVFKIRRKSDLKVLVWKEINYGIMSEKEKQQLVAEVNILRELRHPNIVRYYDRVIDKVNSKIYIVMEFCEGGDMAAVIKKCKREQDSLPEEVIWKIFMQISLALYECHKRKEGKYEREIRRLWTCPRHGQ
jgi:NIMA (never in mitosis gene a)-related kinase